MAADPELEVCTRMGMAEIPRNLRVPAGMGLNVAGIPRGWIWQLQDSRWDGFFPQGPRENGRQIGASYAMTND